VHCGIYEGRRPKVQQVELSGRDLLKGFIAREEWHDGEKNIEPGFRRADGGGAFLFFFALRARLAFVFFRNYLVMTKRAGEDWFQTKHSTIDYGPR